MVSVFIPGHRQEQIFGDGWSPYDCLLEIRYPKMLCNIRCRGLGSGGCQSKKAMHAKLLSQYLYEKRKVWIVRCPTVDFFHTLVGWFEDLCHFSDLSAISRLGSRRWPISEIVAERPGIEPRTSCSASQELNHYTIAAPTFIRMW